ncbi:heterokaryon incompatibility protein-domain-containing protein [Microdochium bolleyi]|uniref:Heterokaryon incompatibility protein-domain-containing protein n=1 Tax=Microdochium bolleyi TaxID=196109 RepID=A0A136JCG8_9PEZI|nr:heterokaryon incompatibility protein-domain-containing protein [Microdochium bolleyi]
MSPETPQPQPPLSDRLCLCKDLHAGCSRETCPQAQFAFDNGYPSTTIAMYRKSGEGKSMMYVWTDGGETGPRPACPTCAAIARALTEPEDIVRTIKASVADHLKKDRTGNFWGSLDRRQVDYLEESWENTYVSLFAPRSAMSAGRRIIRTTPSKYQYSKEAEGAPAPTRLICVADNQVRIVKTGGAVLRYTTLSHRWGHNEQFKLLKATEESMARDIPWDTIPKTFRDAMNLTRQLGVDHIWIDTICIMQDDPDDWRFEATRMKDVYSSSHLNIAANHSLGSNGGLYADRQTAGDFPICIMAEAGSKDSPQSTLCIRQLPKESHAAYSTDDIKTDDLAYSPLLGRGWILQERVLSPRMVYYDSQELKWECRGGCDCLCGGMITMAGFVVAYRNALGISRRDAVLPPLQQNYYYLPIRWMLIAERYSMCDLTFVADRVIALAGVAEQALASDMPTGRYLAGAWEKDLANQLCWEVLDTHRKPQDVYLAPSWSWLSVVGRLRFPNRGEDEMCNQDIAVEITQAECTLVDDSRPTGPITDGFIKVNGNAMEFDVQVVDPGSVSEPQTFTLTHRERGRTLQNMFKPDYVMTTESASSLGTVTLLYWGYMPPNCDVMMVLWHANDKQRVEGKFERLGLIVYDLDKMLDECNEIRDWFEKREGLIIV